MKSQRHANNIKTEIPTQNRWWEIVICVLSQGGNVYRLVALPRNTNTQILLVSSIVGSWIAADFISGFYHWFADSYRTRSPTINAIFFDNFQLHHKEPSLICKRPLANVNWEVNLPSFGLTLLQIFWEIPQSRYFPFLVGVCFWISITNQAHRWAHQPQSKIPTVVKALQRAGIILSPQHHHQHHGESHLEDYCITSGICNPLLRMLNLWRRLETVVFHTCGARSYAMLVQDPKAFEKSAFGSYSTPKEDPKQAESSSHNVTNSYLYDYILSPFYDRLAGSLWPDWVHPNYITLTGGLCCAASIYAFHYNYNKHAFFLWTFYHMMDNMDGKHARRTKQTSKWGAFLDHSVDGLVGVYMGYRVVAQVVFGLDVQSLLFALGRHCFFLLWLAPHIVHQLNPSKGLVLGTKLCSVDEGFLGTSLLLYYSAWISPGQPLVAGQQFAAEILCYVLATIAVGFVTATVAVQTIQKHRQYWALAFLVFASLASTCKESLVWWLLWTPFMMISVSDHS